jgi:hypothetical protein
MKSISRQEILERYDKLPDQIKDAMMSEATADKMREIGQRHELLIDKIGIMAEETGYVILGLERPDEFAKNLKEALEISGDKADEIASSINEEVFKPIRDHLYGINKDRSPEKPSFSLKPSRPAVIPQEIEVDVSPSIPSAPKPKAKIIPPAPPPPSQPATKEGEAPPSFRPSSFAMPISGKSSAQTVKNEAPSMIFEQDKHVVPPENKANPKPQKAANISSEPDPYREAIE